MSQSTHSRSHRLRFLILVVVAVLGVGTTGHYLFAPAFGAQLGNRELQLNDNEVSDQADYQLSFDLSTAGMLGSITVQFCSNDPIPEDSCTLPAGFDVSSATLTTQS